MNLLIVEDERRLAEALEQIFNRNRYTVRTEYDGTSGLNEALTGLYDVVLLDIMLPKMNGLEVLQNIRENKISTPVLLLTAKNEIPDKVKGLDSGADDYLTKPFSTEELLARVRALCRRNTETIGDDTITLNDIVLNLSTYELQCNIRSVKLGVKELNLVQMLMTYGHRVLSKETILEKLWGFDSEAEYNNVEVYISFLRKKLSYIESNTMIKTVRGVGYNLEGGV